MALTQRQKRNIDGVCLFWFGVYETFRPDSFVMTLRPKGQIPNNYERSNQGLTDNNDKATEQNNKA